MQQGALSETKEVLLDLELAVWKWRLMHGTIGNLSSMPQVYFCINDSLLEFANDQADSASEQDETDSASEQDETDSASEQDENGPAEQSSSDEEPAVRMAA